VKPLEQRAEEAFGGVPVAMGLNQDVKRIPVLIHRPPEIVVLAVHGKHDFIQVPLIPTFRLSATEGIGVSLTELGCPLSDGFVGDNHPTIGQDFFYVTEAERETEVKPHRVADDFSWIPVAGVSVGLLAHPQKLPGLGFIDKLTVPPRTTKLYDRTGDEITLDEVERIAI
jgi:hypothetical protein